MNDNASARPLEARIAPARQVRWLLAAVAFMEEGGSPAGVRASGGGFLKLAVGLLIAGVPLLFSRRLEGRAGQHRGGARGARGALRPPSDGATIGACPNLAPTSSAS